MSNVGPLSAWINYMLAADARDAAQKAADRVPAKPVSSTQSGRMLGIWG